MTLKEFVESRYEISIPPYQKRFFEQYEKARKENCVIYATFPRCCGRSMLMEIISKHEEGGDSDMEMGQFNRASQIRGRICELKVLLKKIKKNGDNTDIDGYKIPKNSKEVLLALCQKEIDELEQEFEKL